MTKPVSYYAQNAAIESLIEKYGSSFESLTREQKLLVLVMIVIHLSDGAMEIKLFEPQHIEKGFLDEWGRLITLSSDIHLIGLMLAIVAQLHDKVYAEDKP